MQHECVADNKSDIVAFVCNAGQLVVLMTVMKIYLLIGRKCMKLQ